MTPQLLRRDAESWELEKALRSISKNYAKYLRPSVNR